MILIYRKSYWKWQNDKGEDVYGPKRWNSLPFVCHAVRYTKSGSPVEILPWSRELHDKIFGVSKSEEYRENPKEYRCFPREFAIYLHYRRPRPSTREQVREKCGQIDPCDMDGTTLPEVTQEAFILYTMRRVMEDSGKIWVKESDILLLLSPVLSPIFFKLIEDKIIVKVKDGLFTFGWASKQANEFVGLMAPRAVMGVEPITAEKTKAIQRELNGEATAADYTLPIHGYLKKKVVVSTMVFKTPKGGEEKGDFRRLNEDDFTPKGDERVLCVSRNGVKSFEPKGSTVIRILKAKGDFQKDQVALLISQGGGCFSLRNKNGEETKIDTTAAYETTSAASAATFDELALIPSASYDRVVVYGKPLAPEGRWKHDILRIGNGENPPLMIEPKSSSV